MSREVGNYGSELWTAFPFVLLHRHKTGRCSDQVYSKLSFHRVGNYGPVYGHRVPLCPIPSIHVILRLAAGVPLAP